MTTITIAVLCGVIIYQLIDRLLMISRYEQSYQTLRDEWQSERKDLLDRIQAPTFAEYSNKVIKEKKVDKTEEEPELPYIS